jgi:hypothetical protein
MGAMNWVRRVLTETGDDGRFRSGSAVILGACFVILPLLLAVLDAESVLVATLIGSGVAVLWFVGETFVRWVTIVAFAAFALGSGMVIQQLPSPAIAVFLGGFALTLGACRFLSGWSHPLVPAAEMEVEPGPVHPVVVLAVVLPLLALVALVVVGIARARGIIG